MNKPMEPLLALEHLYVRAMQEMPDPEDVPEIAWAKEVLDAAAAEPEPDEFDQFWQIYPRRVGKPPAKRAFNRLSKKDQRALMDHLPKRKWPGEKHYIPHPSTFINQRRWEDEDQATTVTAQDDIF